MHTSKVIIGYSRNSSDSRTKKALSWGKAEALECCENRGSSLKNARYSTKSRWYTCGSPWAASGWFQGAAELAGKRGAAPASRSSSRWLRKRTTKYSNWFTGR